MKLATVIKKYCEKTGLKPTHIAKKAGMDVGNMSRLMRGQHKHRIAFYRVISLLQACEVDAKDVYDITVE